MTDKGNPKTNFLYNIIYQVLILIVPIIIAPHLSRTLGAQGIGIYSYTYSIVYYFMLLTLLGVNNYGNRTIAKVRDNKELLSKTFWSIYVLQLTMGVIMIIAYLCYIFIFDVRFKTIALLQTTFIVSSILDINWFFFGLEEFKKTITRNSIVKIGNALLIFIIIRNTNDVWKYALIMSSMTCLSQIIMWSFIRKYVCFYKINFNDIKEHIRPNLTLFIPVIAVSIYKIMDKIMLGLLANVTEVGYYENAEKIINVPMAFLAALGTVMLPRMSNLLAKKNIEVIKKYMSKSIEFVLFMSSAMMCGLVAIGCDFAPIFFGKGFEKTGILIVLLSITLPFLAFANVLRTQYLIPSEKDKIYITSVFTGAFVNLLLNALLIPRYKSIGACLGTIAAEASVMISQSISIRKEIPIKEYIQCSIPYILKSLLMLILIYPIRYIPINSFIKIILQVLFGCIIYSLLNIKYVCNILNIKQIIKIIKRKFLKKEVKK